MRTVTGKCLHGSSSSVVTCNTLSLPSLSCCSSPVSSSTIKSCCRALFSRLGDESSPDPLRNKQGCKKQKIDYEMAPIVSRSGFRKKGHQLFPEAMGSEGFGFWGIDQTVYRNATRSTNMEGWELGSGSFELDLPSQIQQALSVSGGFQLAPLHFIVAVAQDRRLGRNCFPQPQALQQKPFNKTNHELR